MFQSTNSQFCLVVFCAFISLSCSEDTFTGPEKAALAKFRPLVDGILVQDYQKLDSYLMRWLRDNSLDVDAAVRGLTEAQQWRKSNKIDTILKENLDDLFADPPAVLDGFDKNGRPIIIWSAKKLDVRKLVVNGERDKLLRYTLQVIEKMTLKAREALNGTGLDSQMVSILDLQGYNSKQHGCLQCIGVYVDWVRHVSKYYPGSLKYDIWINVPRIAKPVLELIKPIMSPLYQKASRVFAGKEEWGPFLLSIIPKDQLAFQYGGTKKN